MASRRTPKHLGAFVLVFEMARRKMDVPYVNGAHGVVVSHPLSMREALGSIPSVSIFQFVLVRMLALNLLYQWPLNIVLQFAI